MERKSKYGKCPKCKQNKMRTNHHIFPKCFYGNSGPTELICRDCHDRLEIFLQKREGRDLSGNRNKLPTHHYILLYYKYIEQ